MGTIILGISPGTKSVGIAVIKNGELVEWKVKSFKGRCSKEKLNLILKSISALHGYHKVNGIALKESSPLHSSTNLKVLVNHIVAFAKRKRGRFMRYTLSDLKRESASNIKHSKDDLMEYFTEKYPLIRKQYLKERNNFAPYYLKMFEAIAAAHILTREIETVK